MPLDVESLVEMSRGALSSFAVEMGLKIARRLLEGDVTQRWRVSRAAARRATATSRKAAALFRNWGQSLGQRSRFGILVQLKQPLQGL